jgi:prepilin-type N-terminal cleavage/methylation domain-containing protein
MNNVNSSPLSASKHKRQQGFTLLELVVVVGIMAVLSSVVSYSGKGRIDDAKLTAAKAEMQSIRAALVAYKRDNFKFPDGLDRTSAVHVSFLFTEEFSMPSEDRSLDDPNTVRLWDADYQRGWRGPYLVGGDSGLVDIGDGLAFTTDIPVTDPPVNVQYTGGVKAVGLGVHTVTLNALKFQRAIPDPFTAFPVANNDNSPDISNLCIDDADTNNKCLLDWRLLGQDEENEDKYAPLSRLGRPYLFFNLNDHDKARIVSMGANGRYESSDSSGSNCADFVPGGDDIVVCLY